MSAEQKRPVRLQHITSGKVVVDTLHQKCKEPITCTGTVCTGSIMRGITKRKAGTIRSKTEIVEQATDFLEQYYSSVKRSNSEAHRKRLAEVTKEIDEKGTYELKETELTYGARLAWRNAPRCIGRIQWSKLQVFDARYAVSAKDMFDAICNHLKYATNKGNIRSAITVFPQRLNDRGDFRVWNTQLIQYAGYLQPDGSVVGDPISVEFTEICQNLGWKGKGRRWDVLPIVVSANGKDPEYFVIPDDLVLQVPITHPTYEWFKDLKLQWYAVPAVSSMLLDVGGIEFPACPFNGWYMQTEIASRDLADPSRYNVVKDVAIKMGLDTMSNSTLWKDRAAVEINYAVIYSFQLNNVTIVDHHSASESFMKHMENELRLRGGCPGDWVWIVPPVNGSLTSVFHQEMLCYTLKPSYEYQEPAWKTHIWGMNNEETVRSSGCKKPSFREYLSAIRLSTNLYGKALSRRIKATILYATETGNSEQYAKILENIFLHAFNAKAKCMSDYDPIDLESEKLLLIVTSTFGNGDPPETGEEFGRHLRSLKNSEDILNGDLSNEVQQTEQCQEDNSEFDIGLLSNVRFAVFGLGSSAYPNFCQFAKDLDNVLSKLGAERIFKFTTGDELCGQEQSFRMWAQAVFQEACDVFCIGDEVDMKHVTKFMKSDSGWSPDRIRLKSVKTTDSNIIKGLSRKTNRKLTFCPLKRRTQLYRESKDRQTILVELDISQSELTYSPGDHVGIYPANRKELVDGILECMGKSCPDPDEVLQVENLETVQTLTGEGVKWVENDRLQPCSLRTALTRYFDVTTPPSQQLLGLLATMAKKKSEKEKLLLLSKDAEMYEDWKSYHYPNILEVLKQFPSVALTPAFVLSQFVLLQPRFYSISSSIEATPGEIHATVAVVTYHTQEGKGNLHYGVCSNYLADLAINSEVVCFVRYAPNFRMPTERESPVIMVGPGTGIAPFRSFWQHRRIDIEKLSFHVKDFGKMLLFAGFRHPDVELYGEEIKSMKQIEVLTDTFTAFSRLPDQPKRYVQDILREISSTIFDLLVKKGGHFYVCGDIKMADDVKKTLKWILQEYSPSSEQSAEILMNKFQNENRYHEDIFGITLKTAEVTSKGRAEAKSRIGLTG